MDVPITCSPPPPRRASALDRSRRWLHTKKEKKQTNKCLHFGFMEETKRNLEGVSSASIPRELSWAQCRCLRKTLVTRRSRTPLTTGTTPLLSAHLQLLLIKH